MTEVRLNRMCLGERISVQVQQVGEGVHIQISGGHRPHIGAVSIAGPDGKTDTVQFPGHRDGTISEAWAGAFARAGFVPAVAEAGIHYDHPKKEEILFIVSVCEDLMQEVLERFISFERK